MARTILKIGKTNVRKFRDYANFLTSLQVLDEIRGILKKLVYSRPQQKSWVEIQIFDE